MSPRVNTYNTDKTHVLFLTKKNTITIDCKYPSSEMTTLANHYKGVHPFRSLVNVTIWGYCCNFSVEQGHTSSLQRAC